MADEEDRRNSTQPPESRAANGITSPLSRSEAVRRALAAGFEAAADGVSYLRKEFGIEISPSLFLAAKATERKKGWTRNGKPGRKPRQSLEQVGETPTSGGQDEDVDDPID